MSSQFSCYTYRGVEVCIVGNVDNWKDVAAHYSLIAESPVELIAWMVYHKKPTDMLTGDFVILKDEPLQCRMD